MMRAFSFLPLATFAAALVACGSSVPTEACGQGATFCAAGDAGGTDADAGVPNLTDSGVPPLGEGGTSDGGGPTSDTLAIVIRDFKLYDANDPKTVADFENVPKTDANGNPDPNYLGPWDDKQVVADALGADGKPVYKSASGTTLTTHGKAGFDTWYRDVPGTNLHVDYPLHLTKNADGSYGYDSQVSGVPLSSADPTKMFFPIDDGTTYQTAFGNQGDPHNYSFTVELHTVFTYQGGEYFNFRGDDDVYVFINGKLVINLGGIHGPETANVNADSLGLTKGQSYPLDFFSAERHKVGSNILFTTTLNLRPAPK